MVRSNPPNQEQAIRFFLNLDSSINHGLSVIELAIGIFLAKHLPNIFPGHDRIAKHLNISLSAVKRGLKRLVKLGYLEIVEHGKEGTTNEYFLKIPSQIKAYSQGGFCVNPGGVLCEPPRGVCVNPKDLQNEGSKIKEEECLHGKQTRDLTSKKIEEEKPKTARRIEEMKKRVRGQSELTEKVEEAFRICKERFFPGFISSGFFQKEHAQAKRLVDLYGVNATILAVGHLFEEWGRMSRNSRGRLKGIPTVGFLLASRDQVFPYVLNELEWHHDGSGVLTGKNTARRPLDKDEWHGDNGPTVGWDDEDFNSEVCFG
jgi:hypothetical protein